jgi:hypothetical protein
MALRIFEARPNRVQIGNTGTASFDTETQYIYKTSSSTIKYTNEPTIRIVGNRLTYSFDGLQYTLNASIAFTPVVNHLSAD